MDKEEAKKEKKRIKELQKARKKAKKEKEVALSKIKIEELPITDLNTARKEHSEKAYASYLIKEIITISNDAIESDKEASKDDNLGFLLEELGKIAKDNTWFYKEKIREFTLKDEEIKTNDIINKTPKTHLINWNNYMLNPVERDLIRLNTNTFLARLKSYELWDQRQWKFSRADAQLLHLLILNGVKEKEILEIEIDIDDKERVSDLRIRYGENNMVPNMVSKINWKWKQYNEEGELIQTVADLSYIIPDSN
ncbi:MAG: hypothetical protein GX366_03680 [Epulopiscium sp.]|nr:hypothetical protein [Candidatus Epulonipiscium sp.]